MYLSSLSGSDDHPTADPLLLQEMEEFHSRIREYIISLIVFIVLYVCSSSVVEFYRRKSDEPMLPPSGGGGGGDYDEDAVVHWISIRLCNFSLAVSAGAVLLHPISIVGNEVLLRFPESYYVKWLNLSLLHTLWNLIFLLSNVSLFGLMPFAWIFTEAEGFSGSRRGLRSRILETCIVLFLLVIITFGLAFVGLAIFADDRDAQTSLFDVWEYHFPFLYSIVSLFGVMLLLICVPLGFARIFTGVGQLLVKPRFLRDLDNELAIARFEEESLLRKQTESARLQQRMSTPASPVTHPLSQFRETILDRFSYDAPKSLGSSPTYSHSAKDVFRPNTIARNAFNYGTQHCDYQIRGAQLRTSLSESRIGYNRYFGAFNGIRANSNCGVFIEEDSETKERGDFEERLLQVQQERKQLERQQKKPKWQRNLGYPVIMISLVGVTGLSFLMVIENVGELLMGYKALPGDGTVHNLGQSSYSAFGSIGSFVQVIVISYVMFASIVGLHSAPGFRDCIPKPNDTPLTAIIVNATLILVLSSAQPLLARTLGLTNFDLLGDYREIRWLRHFYIVLVYNLAFAGSTAWCLLRKITGPVRQELYSRLGSAFKPSKNYSYLARGINLFKLPTFPFSNCEKKKI